MSNHAEFQEKYAVTVITRIFYSVNKCHSGRITSRQVRRSDLLEAFSLVDEEEDINKVTRYFSYEHFYVLYCRFWELDHDRDYKITREDLLKYGDHSLSHMIVDRIFDAAPRPFEQEKVDRDFLSYEDFIYFMPSKTKHTKGDSVEQFLKDMNHLKTLDNPLLTPTHTRTDSSYTRTWTNEDWVRHQVRSFFRYKRHCLSWTKSPTARAVLPTVFVVCLWASLVSLVTSRTPILQVFIQKASFFSGMAAFSAPISLLLALRTNRAMDRLLDARRQFGIMARAVLSLASLTTVYIAPVDLDKALLLGRYLCIYGWIMKGCVRGEDDTSVCRALLPPEEAQWLSNTFSDTPTSILLRLRQVIASVVDKLPLSAATAMEESICELETVLGVCKRLLGSPIPPTYTRHTSRVLCLFLGFLPVAMVGSGVSFLATLLNCALISYVFVGIDEIGVEIEHPFPLLPMYHLSSAIQNNVANQFLSMAMGPPQP